MLTIADTAEALTSEWLTAALTASGTLTGGRVLAADVRPLGTGQMCDSVRIGLRYDDPDAGPASLVARLPAADEGSRATANAPLWDDPSLTELEWLHGDAEGRGALLAEVLPMLWAGFQERYATSLLPHVKQAGDVYFSRLATGRTADRVATVTHTDYRLDNLLIDPDGVVTVVDWRTCGTGVGPATSPTSSARARYPRRGGRPRTGSSGATTTAWSRAA